MADKTTVSKNKTAAVGKYSYKYTDLAQIHEEMERQGLRYYQYVEPFCHDDKVIDYVNTVIMNDVGEELRRVRGCRVVDANGQNPTQEHGKAITYARRYSLLMALGWATDDDDAAGNVKTRPAPKTQAQAKTTASAAFVKSINEEQFVVVCDAIDNMNKTQADICGYFKIKAIRDMTQPQYEELMRIYDDFNWRTKNA